MATRIRKPMLRWCEVTIQSTALCTTNTDRTATSSGASSQPRSPPRHGLLVTRAATGFTTK